MQFCPAACAGKKRAEKDSADEEETWDCKRGRSFKGSEQSTFVAACAQLRMTFISFIHQPGSGSVCGLPDCVPQVYVFM